MQEAFDISDDNEVRLWNKYMSNTYEHLNRSDLAIQDAGLYQGTVRCYGVIENISLFVVSPKVRTLISRLLTQIFL